MSSEDYLKTITLTPEYLAQISPLVDLPANVTTAAAVRQAIYQAIANKVGERNLKEVDISLELVRDILKVRVYAVVDTIQQQIDELSAAITALQQNLGTVQSNYNTVVSRLDGIDTALTGLTIGEEVQAYSAILQQLSGLTLAANRLLGTSGTGQITQYARGYSRIEHRLAPGNIGGNPTGTVSTWVTVPLNTIARQSGALSGSAIALVGNGISLPAGTYRARGRAYGCGVVRFQSRLRDVTNGNTLSIGESVGSSNDSFVNDATYGTLTLSQVSNVDDEFTLSATATIELQAIYKKYHQFSASLGVNVFGSGASQIAAASGTDEKYSSLILERVG